MESKLLLLLAAALVLGLLVGLGSMIFLRAFRHRVRAPSSSRPGPHRLAIVETFDVDRHRQLVIIRRDTVEHLIMIGGPSDLMIETDIQRAESRNFNGPELPREDLAPHGRSIGTYPAEFDLPSQTTPSEPQIGKAAVADLSAGAGTSSETGTPAPAPTHRAPLFPLPPRRMPAPPAPLDQNDFGANRSKVMNVIDTKSLERDAGGKPGSPFPHPALAQRTQQHREPPSVRNRPEPKSDEKMGTITQNPGTGFLRTPAAPFIRPPTRRTGHDTSRVPSGPDPTTAPAPTPEVLSPSAPLTSTSEAMPELAKPEAQGSIKSNSAPSQPEASAGEQITAGSAPPQETIDFLEAEMAQLLGRGPSRQG